MDQDSYYVSLIKLALGIRTKRIAIAQRKAKARAEMNRRARGRR